MIQCEKWISNCLLGSIEEICLEEW